MSVEMIQAIGQYVVTPIAGVCAFGLFFYFISKH